MAAYDSLFKVVMVGDERVGKSAMLARFTEGRFVHHYDATIGVQFASRVVEADGHRYKLQIWDTAGMEKFRAITASYYRGAAVHIVVYSSTDMQSYEHVGQWITKVRQGNCDALLFVVGTHSDSPKRVVFPFGDQWTDDDDGDGGGPRPRGALPAGERQGARAWALAWQRRTGAADVLGGVALQVLRYAVGGGHAWRQRPCSRDRPSGDADAGEAPGREVPLVEVDACTGRGVEELFDLVVRHAARLGPGQGVTPAPVPPPPPPPLSPEEQELKETENTINSVFERVKAVPRSVQQTVLRDLYAFLNERLPPADAEADAAAPV